MLTKARIKLKDLKVILVPEPDLVGTANEGKDV